MIASKTHNVFRKHYTRQSVCVPLIHLFNINQAIGRLYLITNLNFNFIIIQNQSEQNTLKYHQNLKQHGVT